MSLSSSVSQVVDVDVDVDVDGDTFSQTPPPIAAAATTEAGTTDDDNEMMMESQQQQSQSQQSPSMIRASAPPAVVPSTSSFVMVVHDSLSLYRSLIATTTATTRTATATATTTTTKQHQYSKRKMECSSSVELSKVRCFLYRQQYILGLEVVYTCTFANGRVKEIESEHLVFRGFTEGENNGGGSATTTTATATTTTGSVIVPVTFELDVNDFLVDIIVHKIQDATTYYYDHHQQQPQQSKVTGLTFVTHQGRRETVGRIHQSMTHTLLTTRGSTNRNSNSNSNSNSDSDSAVQSSLQNPETAVVQKIVALRGTLGRMHGVLQDVGYYVSQVLVPASAGATATHDEGPYPNHPRELLLWLHHCDAKKSNTSQLFQYSSPQNRFTEPLAISHASQVYAELNNHHNHHHRHRRQYKCRNVLPLQYYSELGFYQRLWNHSLVQNVKLSKLCCYFDSQTGIVLRMFAVYHVTKKRHCHDYQDDDNEYDDDDNDDSKHDNENNSMVSSSNVLSVEHSSWREQHYDNSNNSHNRNCILQELTLQSGGEYVTEIQLEPTMKKKKNNKKVSSSLLFPSRQQQQRLQRQYSSDSTKRLMEVVVVTNQRSTRINVHGTELIAADDNDCQEDGDSDGSSARKPLQKLVAITGILHHRQHRGDDSDCLSSIHYVTEATNWHIVKPWCMLRYAFNKQQQRQQLQQEPVASLPSSCCKQVGSSSCLSSLLLLLFQRRRSVSFVSCRRDAGGGGDGGDGGGGDTKKNRKKKKKNRKKKKKKKKDAATMVMMQQHQECHHDIVSVEQLLLLQDDNIFCHILSFLIPS